MHLQVGKIIHFRNKFPGPPVMHANSVGEGMRKAITLCHICTQFQPGRSENCSIAEKLFQFNRTNSTGTALVRCASFVSGVDETEEQE